MRGCWKNCERIQEAASNAATELDGVRTDMQRRLGALEEDLRDNKSNRDSDLQIIEKALTIAHSNQEKVCSSCTLMLKHRPRCDADHISEFQLLLWGSIRHESRSMRAALAF